MLIVFSLTGIVVVAAALAWTLSHYNRLVRARHEVDNAASQIHVELQSRHDLVPGLVECVGGHAMHEREIIERVVEAHSRALQVTGLSAEVFDRENALSAALIGLQRVFSVGYPALTADLAFASLSNRLVEIEERLSRSRQYYNDAVFRLSTSATQFPGTLIAEAAGIKELPPYFHSVEGAQTAPKFSLTTSHQGLPAKT